MFGQGGNMAQCVEFSQVETLSQRNSKKDWKHCKLCQKWKKNNNNNITGPPGARLVLSTWMSHLLSIQAASNSSLQAQKKGEVENASLMKTGVRFTDL